MIRHHHYISIILFLFPIVISANIIVNTTANTTDVPIGLRINATIAALPKVLNMTRTVDWPRRLDGKRFTGSKEYVIVLHDNLEWERKESKEHLDGVILAENTTLIRNLTIQHQHINTTELQPIYARMTLIRASMTKVYQSVTVIRRQIKRRSKILEGAKATINRTDTNWNVTISAFRSQHDAVIAALRHISHMQPILTGAHPTSSVAKMLKFAQTSSNHASTKVNTLLKTAIKASYTAQGTPELQKLLTTLKNELEKHGVELLTSLKTAIESRKQHLAQLHKKIEPYLNIIKMLHHMVNVSLQTIPDYKKDLLKAVQETRPILARMQQLQDRMQQSTDRITEAEYNYDVEMKNIMARVDTMESIHQLVKDRLLGTDIVDQTTLYSITNILKPYGMNQMVWNPYYPHNLSDPSLQDSYHPYGMSIPNAINPFYFNTSAVIRSCGNWQFNEKDGNPYALDTSGRGYDGVLHGGLHYRIPNTGGFQFDGMQTYVDVGKLGKVAATFQQFSIDLWIKTLDTHPALSTIMKYIDYSDKSVFAIEPNRRVGRVINGVSAYGEQISSITDYESGSTLVYLRDYNGKTLAGHVRAPYFDNKWHRLSILVLNATQNKMVFYMDGKLQNWIATIEQSPSDFRPMDSNMFIGAGNNRGHPEGFFDGALRSVRILCGSHGIVLPKCCRTCNSTTSIPCGSMCIKKTLECHLPPGCACPSSIPSTPKPTPSTTPTPTVTKTPNSLIPNYPRADTPMNQNSIFPGNGTMIPEKPDDEITTTQHTQLRPAAF